MNLAPQHVCSGCTACFAVCPVSAIRMEADREGFQYPVIDDAVCIACGRCEKVCPVLHRSAPREPLAVYAAINRDDRIRKQSSSGGLFTLLAREVLSEGGIVYGAGWSPDFRVVHKAAENEGELADLRGSKYAQSELGDVFRQVKEQLGKGRKVLFSGTPCQIGGLRAYFREARAGGSPDEARLLCVDLICHAVPSPKVFALYKKELEARYGAKVSGFSFRDKRGGWRRYSVVAAFENGREYGMPQDQDPFLQGFLKDLYTRPSCLACSFRELRSGADLTLADYWGVEQRFPQLDDDRGTSLILAETPAGLEAVRRLRNVAETAWAESDYADVKTKNAAVCLSPQPHKKRRDFFDQLERGAALRLIERLLRPPLLRRLRAAWRRWRKGVFAK